MTKAKSIAVAEKTVFAALSILKEAGGELPGKEVVQQMSETLDFNDYEAARYEKTGYVRWQSILHFYTIDCTKAGYMRKKKGLWIITKEGEEALELGPEKLLKTASKKYRAWDAERKKNQPKPDQDDEGLDSDTAQAHKAVLSQFEETASSGLKDYITKKNPYEFQDIVAALLDGMGYHISEIASRGPDGGIDIIAYTDPLGTKLPRIIVQVKHRPEASISSDEIQKLAGTLKRTSDVGIFVTSGLFSKPAMKEARESREHIELIDFERFLTLWIENYPDLSDEQKNMLPLQPIYFLGSNE
ncbi:MAG: restriction endonuclease [FCB group bacterium]|nr:restriction endonuclease [FCB group bacterium]